MRRSSLLLACVLLAACTSPQPTPVPPTSTRAPTTIPPTTTLVAPTGDPKPGPRLFGAEHIYGSAPAIPHGPPDAWDADHTVPGAVVFHEGTFYLFRKGWSDDGPGLGAVGLSTSPDGFTWTSQPDPLFTDLGIAGLTPPGLFASSVLVEGDQWIMYLWGAVPGEDHPLARIWRATAPAADGPWTADPQPVLTAGPPGAWDDAAVLFPNVIRTDDGYLMYYDAWSVRGDEGIGLATSPDGMTWTRYDDPATTDPLYAHGDPVFSAQGHAGWDRRTMRPSVVLTPDGFVMAYLGFQANDRSNAYGLAFSDDGVHWERYSGNPVLVAEDAPAGGNLREHRLFYHDHTYFLFFEAGTNAATDIWLAVFEGSLSELRYPVGLVPRPSRWLKSVYP